MKPLRAFLCFKESTGDWTTAAFRDLEPLMEAWHEVRNVGRSGAAVHVGFWRPETSAMAALIEKYPGNLLLSSAARSSLPPPLEASEFCVGKLENLGFYLALRGFGYEIQDPTKQALEEIKQARNAELRPLGLPTERNWVSGLSVLSNELALLATQAGILDDKSYYENEVPLRHAARQKLGMARFQLLTGLKLSSENILDNLSNCPLWFRSINLHGLGLTVRQTNVFRAYGFNTIEDLISLRSAGLFKLNQMGRKSVNELAILLYKIMLEGPPKSSLDLKDVNVGVMHPIEAGVDISDAVLTVQSRPILNIRDSIVEAVQNLSTNQRGVLAARMGFECERMTLQEISDSIGVTRERVRQIEVKICNILRSRPCWADIETRLAALLGGRVSPLLLDGISAIDPWFEGLKSSRGPLEYIFEKLLDGRLWILNIEGAYCISRLSPAEWDSDLRSAKKLIESCVPDQILEEEIRHMVESLLVGSGEELRADLWHIASRAAHFAELPDGKRHLMAYANSAEAVVFAMLAGASEPLHYSEIHRRVLANSESPVEIRRIHNAASNVGILFSRGTFGLPMHCPLSVEELASVRTEVEEFVASDAVEKQWHCMEIFETLVDRGFSFDERLSKYVVNFALRGSSRLVYLGRLVWGLAESWRESAASRIDVRQAVIALLERQGRPMTTAEIRFHLELERGVNVHFQIFPVDPLVRTGPGEWGLLNRDLEINVERAHEVLEILRGRLHGLGHGIHLTEVERQVNSNTPGNIHKLNPYWIATLAKQAGLRIDKGQYIYLPEWGGSRRMGVQDSVRAALNELGSSAASIDEIWLRANQLSLRNCPKTMISQALQSIDATFDPVSGLWSMDASIGSHIDEDQAA